MPTMEWSFARPTGRRVICPSCGKDAGEVSGPKHLELDGPRSQVALHGDRHWGMCPGSGEQSDHLPTWYEPGTRPTPLCPICPICKILPLWLNSVMGTWECRGMWADEPMKHWRFDDNGNLHEVPHDFFEKEPDE